MDRRSFLRGAKAAAGLTIAGPALNTVYAANNVSPASGVNRVAIIGAGIVGASIAYNLSKRGCDVVLIEKRAPATQASGNSFAWINASYFDMPRSYFELREHSLNEFHRLAQDIDIPIHWGGSLEWYHTEERQREVAHGVSRIQRYGAPTWMIDKDRAAEIEPNLNPGGNWQVAWCSRDGAVDPGAMTRTLVERVSRYGGAVVFPATVTGIRNNRKRMLVDTDIETFEVDLAVVAAGVSANDIAAMIGLGTELVRPATSGLIVTTRPMAAVMNAVSYTTDCHFHQLADGRVVIGEKSGAPQTERHLAYLEDRPNTYPSPDLAVQHGARVIDIAKRYVPQLANTEIESVGVGWRPLPLDGLPIIGRPNDMPGIYLAAMHSGVTLAPIVGHLAAMEILDGIKVELLSDFRVERLTTASRLEGKGPAPPTRAAL